MKIFSGQITHNSLKNFWSKTLDFFKNDSILASHPLPSIYRKAPIHITASKNTEI